MDRLLPPVQEPDLPGLHSLSQTPDPRPENPHHLTPLQVIGRVHELWRYPVKSMQGESVSCLFLDSSGVLGDRRYALESEDAPVGKPLLSGAQRAALLPLHAHAGTASGRPTVTLASTETIDVDDPRLLATLSQTLPATPGLHLRHNQAKPFTDVRPISLHSLQTIHQLSQELRAPVDPRRLRSNIHLDLASAQPFAEDDLTGRTLRIGSSVTLRILERIPRCRIVALDPDTAAFDRSLLTHLARQHGGRAGIYARTLVPGPIRLDDEVSLLPL